MLFNSTHFFLFFPAVLVAYFTMPHRFRWVLLLVASCYFYMVLIPAYILLLFFTIGVDYAAALGMEGARPGVKKGLLTSSLAANLGLLFFFKYYNFASLTAAQLSAHFGIAFHPSFLDIVMPIGLSFHTFQAMSYTIDVYRGHQKAERHLGIFALFVLFFPQLVAGPIESAKKLLWQFKEEHHFDSALAVGGCRLMLFGLFQKVLIADRLGIFVNPIYQAPQLHDGISLILASFAFSVQIYCDFSGYSNIAIGCAQVFGFRLSTNFAQPYFSESIIDFWKRWHISLTSWFREYVFFSLGGSRVSPLRRMLNVSIVFLLSGLWHGASWTYVAWGGAHALLYAGNVVWRAVFGEPKAHTPVIFRRLKQLVTFVLVSAAWVFFRANSATDAFYIFSIIPQTDLSDFHAVIKACKGTGLWLTFIFVVAGFAFESTPVRPLLKRFLVVPAPLRWVAYAAIVLLMMNLGVVEEIPFIYFQF